MKPCSKCKTEKPRTEYHRRSAAKDGLHPHCKLCVAEYKEKYNKDNRERINQYSRQYYADNKEHYRQYNQQYYADNREYHRQYYKDNKEHKRQLHRQYYIDNKERIRQYTCQYRVDNQDRRLQYNRQHRENNPELYAAYCRNRAAVKRNAEGTHTSDDINYLRELQDHKCNYCKTCVKYVYHVDHIVALGNGGTNWTSNLQILCPSCNVRKHTKCPIEFAIENDYPLQCPYPRNEQLLLTKH